MDTKEALEIIRMLAKGIDPSTGEVFEEESPYRAPKITQALFKAADVLRSSLPKDERKDSLPKRAGEPWTEKESQEIQAAFSNGLSFVEIAKKHQRTSGAIRSQLQKIMLFSFFRK